MPHMVTDVTGDEAELNVQTLAHLAAVPVADLRNFLAKVRGPVDAASSAERLVRHAKSSTFKAVEKRKATARERRDVLVRVDHYLKTGEATSQAKSIAMVAEERCKSVSITTRTYYKQRKLALFDVDATGVKTITG